MEKRVRGCRRGRRYWAASSRRRHSRRLSRRHLSFFSFPFPLVGYRIEETSFPFCWLPCKSFARRPLPLARPAGDTRLEGPLKDKGLPGTRDRSSVAPGTSFWEVVNGRDHSNTYRLCDQCPPSPKGWAGLGKTTDWTIETGQPPSSSRLPQLKRASVFFLDLIAEVTRGCGRWLEKDSKVLSLFVFGRLAKEKSGARLWQDWRVREKARAKMIVFFLSLVFVVLDGSPAGRRRRHH